MPDVPPAVPPVIILSPPVQPPTDPLPPPRQPLTFFWNTATSTDPTIETNWFPSDVHGIPHAGDTARFVGNTMTVHGEVLKGVSMLMGTTGVEVPMPDPVLNVTGGADLLLISESPPDNGSHIQINVTGENTLDILCPDSGQELHPTKTTMDVNVADNSMVIGRLQIVNTPFFMHANGANTTFQLEAGKDSSLVRANNGADGYVHIEPNMIGTGKVQMAFSNLELSGSVAPQVEFDLNESSSLILDHADTFHGVAKFAQPGSVITLKDMQFGTNFSVSGGLFTGTTADGRSVNFQLQFDSTKADAHALNTSDGLEIFLTGKG